MPQDINQSFPDPLPNTGGMVGTIKSKVSERVETCINTSVGQVSMEATLPWESLSDCSARSNIHDQETSSSKKPKYSRTDTQDSRVLSGECQVSVCKLEMQDTTDNVEDLETDIGYGSRDSPNCIMVSTQEGRSCTSGQFSEQGDLPIMIHYGTTWTSPSGSQTEDLLFHFDKFFRRRFETELDEFKEAMEEMFSEQQIHLKRIMLKMSEYDEGMPDQLVSSQIDSLKVPSDVPDSFTADNENLNHSRSNYSDQSADVGCPRSVFLIRLLTNTCRLVTRLQSTAFHL